MKTFLSALLRFVAFNAPYYVAGFLYFHKVFPVLQPFLQTLIAAEMASVAVILFGLAVVGVTKARRDGKYPHLVDLVDLGREFLDRVPSFGGICFFAYLILDIVDTVFPADF